MGAPDPDPARYPDQIRIQWIRIWPDSKILDPVHPYTESQTTTFSYKKV